MPREPPGSLPSQTSEVEIHWFSMSAVVHVFVVSLSLSVKRERRILRYLILQNDGSGKKKKNDQ